MGTITCLQKKTEFPSSSEESASPGQEQDPEISFHSSLAQPAPQVIPNMFMPYIESPKMDWTVNDGLYHKVLKWRLKCENILGCGFVALPE